MRAHGCYSSGGSQSERSHILEALQTNERDQLRRRRTLKNAPDPISTRRIETKLDQLDRDEMRLREKLNSMTPADPAAYCRCGEPITIDQAYSSAGRCPSCFSLASSTHHERT